MRFTALCVEGFRSLVDTTLPLRPLNAMIGPNGCGKTSILNILELLRDAAQEKLAEAVERMGGVSAVLSGVADRPTQVHIELTIDVESERSQEPMRYSFAIAPQALGYIISRERLEWAYVPGMAEPFLYIDARPGEINYAFPNEQASVSHQTWRYSSAELALAQVPRTYPEPETLRNALAKTRSYGFLDVRPSAVVRLPQTLTPAASPGPNGESLYAALYNLRTTFPDAYEQIAEVLHLGFPGFQRLEFPVVGAGQVAMAWHQSDLTRPLYANELSEGTLRFLWLATILLSPQVSPVTLFDEPEVSLHPELLKLLAGLLQDASARAQILVATHAAELVRWLNPDEVVVLDKVDGATQCRRADSLPLDEWLKEYTLGELWVMGTLGGRP